MLKLVVSAQRMRCCWVAHLVIGGGFCTWDNVSLDDKEAKLDQLSNLPPHPL